MPITKSKPTPRVSQGKLFVARLRELAAYADLAAGGLVGGLPGVWCRPDDLTTSLFDLPAMSASFSRAEQEDAFVRAAATPSASGTVGDLQLVALQGQWLQVYERAFRARHSGTVRSRIHPSARLRGHGHANGLIMSGLLGHVATVDRLNRGET